MSRRQVGASTCSGICQTGSPPKHHFTPSSAWPHIEGAGEQSRTAAAVVAGLPGVERVVNTIYVSK
jgi:hypothetical protein